MSNKRCSISDRMIFDPTYGFLVFEVSYLLVKLLVTRTSSAKSCKLNSCANRILNLKSCSKYCLKKITRKKLNFFVFFYLIASPEMHVQVAK